MEKEDILCGRLFISGKEGPPGPKGDPFTYEDFTPEQLENLKGPKGDTGPVGPQGEVGPKGPQGPKGEPFTYEDFTPEQLNKLKGPKGDTGPRGEQGQQGIQGPKGDVGPIGRQGPIGETGPQGEQGPEGPIGPQGIQGPQGEKGDKGDTGSSGVYIGDTEPIGDYNVWIDPNGSETAGLATKAELANKQDKLTAGDNITIDSNNVISASGGGSSAECLISKSMRGYNQPESEWGWIADWAQHPEKYYVVIHNDNSYDCPVIFTYHSSSYFYYCWFKDDLFNTGYIKFTDKTLSQVQSVGTSLASGTAWLTEQNWRNYIAASGNSDWQVTTSTSEGTLYNAKEVVIFWQDNNSNRHQSYLNVSCDYYGNSGNTWGSSLWTNTQITLDSYTPSTITYNGSSIEATNCTIEAICYKT